MRKSIHPMRSFRNGDGGCAAPDLIVSRSFQWAIPGRVALPRSPPPLHQLALSLIPGKTNEQEVFSERRPVT